MLLRICRIAIPDVDQSTSIGLATRALFSKLKTLNKASSVSSIGGEEWGGDLFQTRLLQKAEASHLAPCSASRFHRHAVTRSMKSRKQICTMAAGCVTAVSLGRFLISRLNADYSALAVLGTLVSSAVRSFSVSDSPLSFLSPFRRCLFSYVERRLEWIRQLHRAFK